MEIAVPVPDGCQISSVHLKADSQEVYDGLLAEHADDPTLYESTHSPAVRDGIGAVKQSFFWREEDGRVIWVDGPDRKVKVTVEDV